MTALLWVVIANMYAQQGSSCADPIPLGKNYNAVISKTGTVWYVANTFDLPLTVKFYPQNSNDPAPEIQMDFSCTSGVYEDSILCSLFCSSRDTYASMPHTAVPARKTDSSNRLYYEVAMGEMYRNLLLQAGISYNVAVYVKVTYHGGGQISLTPDTEFSECMETDKWLLLGKTLPVSAKDEETFFIAPYANWVNDSVRYVWSGRSKATIVVGTTCSYSPLDALDERRIDVMEMSAPADTAYHTNALIQHYMTYMNNASNTAKGGIFYVKVVSDDAGSLKVERMPAPPPARGATLLSYDKATPIAAKDTNALYAMPSTWSEDTRLFAPTDYTIRMYVGATAEFTPVSAIDSFRYSEVEGGRELLLDKNLLSGLTSRAKGHYLYLRFVCNTATSVTPTLWTPSFCYEKTEQLPMATIPVKSRATTVYRLYYNDYKGGEITFSWNQSSNCPLYIADTCVFALNQNNDRVVYFNRIPKQSSLTISAERLASLGDRTDAEGYLYLRFYPSYQGNITVSSSRPEEPDPTPQPVVHPRAGIALFCQDNTGEGGRYVVRVSAEQDMVLYRGVVPAPAGEPVEQWHQMPGESHTVTLSTGQYTLFGSSETVVISVP